MHKISKLSDMKNCPKTPSDGARLVQNAPVDPTLGQRMCPPPDSGDCLIQTRGAIGTFQAV